MLQPGRKGNVDLVFASFLISCSSLNLLPIFAPATCIISWFSPLHHYSLVIYFCFYSLSSAFYSFFLLFPQLFFQPTLILCFLLWTDSDGNLRMKILPREGGETQGSHNLLKRSCSYARFPVSSPLNLPRQFHEEGGRKAAMTTEGLIVSSAFCWWASSRPQSGN